MRKSKGKICSLILMILILFTGCGSGESADVEIPDILFLENSVLMGSNEDEENYYSISFYDKDGNYYISMEYELYMMPVDELIAEYKAGNLGEYIEYRFSCDEGELLENYKKLCELASLPNYELNFPEVIPAAEPTSKVMWYGLYYDKKGTIQRLPISEKETYVECIPTDKRATEIYDWILSTFSK